MNKKTLISLVIVLVVGVVLYMYGSSSREAGTPKQSLVPYSSVEYKVAFEHPSGLYLKEIPNVGTAEQPQLAVAMVEDTQVNRDILDGKSIEGGEGPTAITVEAYQNPTGLSAEKWAEQNTNWTVSSKNLQPASVANQDGISFNWDGLYQGKTIIVTKGKLAYAFSVTWLTPEDQLIKDFDMVLNSVVFAE